MAKLLPFLIALVIGVINAVVYVIFEWLVNNGTNFLWNDLFHTDSIRWIVIPIAILLSMGFSALVKLLKQDRLVQVKTDLMSELEIKPTTVKTIGLIFIIGLASLLAGASLGPEASLLGMSIGIGVLLAQKLGKMNAAGLFALTSVGALLVAFLGSLFPIFIPLLMLYKKEKKIVFSHMVPPIIGGLAAYVTLILIKGKAEGYGTIPVSHEFLPIDLLASLLLGIAGAFVALLLKSLIMKFAVSAKRFEKSLHWLVSAVIFGTVIGIVYFVGGQSVQFSGSEGTKLLAASYHNMTPFFLLLLVLAKLIATSWSISIGYRGGLVFPSIYMGAAMGIVAGMLLPVGAGPGLVLGSISGIITAMTTPLFGFFLIIAVAPPQQIFVVMAGILGAVIGKKVLNIIQKK